MFKPEVFRKQIHCIEESACDIVGDFSTLPAVIRCPNSDSAPGELCPPCPLVTPWALSQVLNLATIYVKTFVSFGLPGSFLPDITY